MGPRLMSGEVRQGLESYRSMSDRQKQFDWAARVSAVVA